MEMAQNAIEWGNRHQSDRLVKITYRVYEDRLEIVVRDQGPGFDRTNLPHAAIARRPVHATSTSARSSGSAPGGSAS